MLDGKIAAIALNPSVDKTITLEKLVPYGLNRVKSARLDPGGKGVNVARVLKSFGADVTVSGIIAGNNGALLKEFLDKAGIENDFLCVPGETRTNFKVFDETAGKMTEINESGIPADEKIQSEFKGKFREIMHKISMVVLSGSLPPEVPSSFYAECIEIAKAGGVKTLLDADGEALQKGIKAVPYAVKPNIHELEALIGKKCSGISDVAAAAHELIDTGIEIVIVSMGPDGALVAGKNETYKVDSWDIPVKSTVGAGDSMVGSLAYSLLKSDSLYDIALITTAAGTITASKAGTEICTKKEVLDNLSNVTVHRI